MIEFLKSFFSMQFIVGLIIDFFYVLSVVKTTRAINKGGANLSEKLPWAILFPLIGFFVYFVILVKMKNEFRKISGGQIQNTWWILGIFGQVLNFWLIIFQSKTDTAMIILSITSATAIVHWILIVDLRSDIQVFDRSLKAVKDEPNAIFTDNEHS